VYLTGFVLKSIVSFGVLFYAWLCMEQPNPRVHKHR